jgi:hypothetical protein
MQATASAMTRETHSVATDHVYGRYARGEIRLDEVPAEIVRVAPPPRPGRIASLLSILGSALLFLVLPASATRRNT